MFSRPSTFTAVCVAKETGDADGGCHKDGDDHKDGQCDEERVNLVEYLQNNHVIVVFLM